MNTVDTSTLPPKPKRFLTAYNFFFMHERALYLEPSREEKEKSSTTTPITSTLANAKNTQRAN
eukprot:3865472-Ditylum_brightwellii.AAC.1